MAWEAFEADAGGPRRIPLAWARVGRRGHCNALRPLLTALDDRHPPIRRAAALGLGAIHDPRAVRALREALHDNSFVVRQAATTALIRFKPRPSVRASA